MPSITGRARKLARTLSFAAVILALLPIEARAQLGGAVHAGRAARGVEPLVQALKHATQRGQTAADVVPTLQVLRGNNPDVAVLLEEISSGPGRSTRETLARVAPELNALLGADDLAALESLVAQTRARGMTETATLVSTDAASRLCLQTSGDALGSLDALGQIGGPVRYYASADELAVAMRAWDAEVAAWYLGPPGRDYMPDALPRFSAARQRANAHRIYRAGEVITSELQRYGAEMAAGAGTTHDATARTSIDRVHDAIRDAYFRDRMSAAWAGWDLRRNRASWINLMEGTGAADMPYSEVRGFLDDYHGHIDALRARHGDAFFPDEAVTKAGFDAYAMFMLGRLAHLDAPSMRSVYALSLLHPITDGAIDSGLDLGRTMSRLTAKLQGQSPVPETPYEKLVWELVDDILAAYPEADHPTVRSTLLALQQEQLLSVELQRTEAPFEARVHNSLRKGSLTALLFGYLSFGKLSAGQTEYFYKAGGMLQIVDDLLDTTSDLAEGNHTVWTLAYQGDNGSLADPMKRLLALQTRLEADGPRLLSDLPNQDAFLNAFQFGFRLFIMSAVFDPLVAAGTRSVIGDRLPLAPEHLVSTVYGTFGAFEAGAGERMPVMAIFDRGFLNGRYAREGVAAAGVTSLVQPGWTPDWWVTRFSHASHDWFSRQVRAPRISEGFTHTILGLGGLYMSDLAYQLSEVGHPELWLPTMIGLYMGMRAHPEWAVPLAVLALVAAHGWNALDESEHHTLFDELIGAPPPEPAEPRQP